MGHLPTVGSAEFESMVLQAPQPVLVDFYATWCGPCRMVTPILEDLAGKLDKISFVKVDIDESPDVAEKYAVAGVPTLVLFKNGDEVDRKVGAHPRPALEGWLTPHGA